MLVEKLSIKTYKNYLMFNKQEILAIIIVLLFAFYFVIWAGTGKTKDSYAKNKIKRYLFGVRILIIIIAIVSLILWLLL